MHPNSFQNGPIMKYKFKIIVLLIILHKNRQKLSSREDAMRIGGGGTVRKQPVDVSPLRRINRVIYLLACGTRDRCFKTQKTTMSSELNYKLLKGADSELFWFKKEVRNEKVTKGNG